jgi:hypothetical protein
VSGSARLDVALLNQFHAIVVDTHQEEMAVSDTARLDVVLRCQLHAIVAAIARRYRSRHVDVICHRRGFRGDSPGMDGYTRHPRWAQTVTALSKERLVPHALRRYGET